MEKQNLEQYMIAHIVFNEPDVEVLKQAMQLQEDFAGDIRLIRDDYAVGPVAELSTPEGWQQRRDWWRMLLEATAQDAEQSLAMVDDKKELHELCKWLGEDEARQCWIWAAQNKHDVCGYYWLVSQLADFQGRIFILYLNNLPFINEAGGIFYPQWLSQIPPREFLKARKLARPVTPSEFEVDADEWKRLCRENGGVRWLEGGKKLVSAPLEYFDGALQQYIGGDFIKAARVIQQFLTKEKETTGDVFLLWRIKQLLQAGPLELRGDLNGGARDFEIRDPRKPALRKKATAEDAAEPNPQG